MTFTLTEAEIKAHGEAGGRLLARQPIFDTQEKVVAYELLARRGALDTDEKQENATDDIIEQVANLGGLGPLTNHRPALINLTRGALLSGRYELLPKACVLYELLEHITVDREVVAACEKMVEAGYRLALDDVVDLEPVTPLLPLAKMIKVDFGLTQPKQQDQLANAASRHGMVLLAEKIETRAQFEFARAIGYHRFQGFFFEKPQLVARSDVSPSAAAYVRLLSLVAAAEVDFGKVENVLKRDVSLSTRLLRYLRTHASLIKEVTSIKQAVVMLGEEPLRRWVAVMGVAVLAEGQPQQLVVQSLQRAAFCESMAEMIGLGERGDELFLLGLLSLIDTLTRRPLDEVLITMPVPYDIRAALLGGKTPMGRLLALARACERGDEPTMRQLAHTLGLRPQDVPARYYHATGWADAVVSDQDA